MTLEQKCVPFLHRLADKVIAFRPSWLNMNKTFDLRFNISQVLKEKVPAFLASFSSPFKVKDLSSFPAYENPFWHDAYHTGTSLGKNLMVMNTLGGYSDKDVDYIILIHIPTGQRIRIDVPPTDVSAAIKAAEQDITLLREEDANELG